MTTKTTPDESNGWSAFGSFNFTPQWAVFGRYDALNPSEKLAPTQRYDLYNLGISYEPVKTVDLALVYKHEDIRSSFSTMPTLWSPPPLDQHDHPRAQFAWLGQLR